jgi:hypothetical protein
MDPSLLTREDKQHCAVPVTNESDGAAVRLTLSADVDYNFWGSSEYDPLAFP